MILAATVMVSRRHFGIILNSRMWDFLKVNVFYSAIHSPFNVLLERKGVGKKKQLLRFASSFAQMSLFFLSLSRLFFAGIDFRGRERIFRSG